MHTMDGAIRRLRLKTSPGMTTTATPRRSIAVRIATRRIRENCSGTPSRRTRCTRGTVPAGCVSWKYPLPISARDVRGDREHRHAAALSVEEPVDQVQVPRAAARRAHGQLAGARGLSGRGHAAASS